MARSARSSRVWTSPRTTSVGQSSRAATRCCASRARTSSPTCTTSSSPSGWTSSRRRASDRSAPSSTSTTSPTAPMHSTWPRPASPRRWPPAGRPTAVHGSWPARSAPAPSSPRSDTSAFTDLRDAYEEQAAGLLEGGVDLFIIETCMDLLQAKAAMIACRRAMKAAGRLVPLQVQVTIETTGRMLVGSEIGAALTSLLGMKPDVLGINCATGPVEMQEHLRYLSHHSPVPVSVLPNAGLPSVVDGRTHYDLTRGGAGPLPSPPRQRPGHHHRRWMLRHHARAPGRGGRGRPGPGAGAPLAQLRAQRDLHLHARDDGAGPQLPDHRRAHQRQRLEGVPGHDAGRGLGRLHPHGDRADP